MSSTKFKSGIGILIMAIILFSSFACAFGINSNYLPDYPLELYPGETRDIFLTLSTGATSGDINIKASITQGSQIASLIDPSDIYLVPENGRKNVNIRVSLPETAKIGDNYTVVLDCITVEASSGGGLGFKSAIGKGFPVQVIPKSGPAVAALPAKKPPISPIVYAAAIAIIAIIAVIVVLALSKRNSAKKKKR